MSNQIIEINGKRIGIFDYEQSKHISIHTGKELLQISFNCDIRGEEENKRFLNILDSEKINVKLSSQDDAPHYFIAKEKTYSYSDRQDGQPNIYSHNMTLKEKEILDIKKIKISDLVFEPYQYSEDDEDDIRIIIKFKCIIGDETRTKLLALLYSDQIKLEVIRDEIDKQPRIMRFGRLTWSKKEDEQNNKYEIILVDYGDEDKINAFADPLIVDNLSDQITRSRLISEKLIKKLIEKGIISKEDIALNKKDEKDWATYSKLHHDLFRVEDIDKD